MGMRSLSVAQDPPDGRPMYRRIADQIRARIEAGELAAGARLPPIRSLAAELGVNRDTVALAYEALAGEGRLDAFVGRGTFVTRPVEAGPREPACLALSPLVERLIGIENMRPRFGAAGGAARLHSLIPDPALYPIEDFRRALNRALAEGGADLFLYGSAQGHTGLREVLARRFVAAGIAVTPAEIALCHGASQGIALAIRLFAGPGDAVAVEIPTYHNVLTTLASLGVAPVGIPIDSEVGPDLAALERALARPEVKAFYTIPTFHNPLGTTTDLAHRRALLEVAARCGKPVIEDAFEMDLRFEGRTLAPLAALDEQGLVVHLFSFSKSLFPGARVGSIAVRGRAIEGLVALKHASDLSDSMPLQAAMAEFVSSGAYDRHLGRVRRVLRARHRALAEALETSLPEGCRWTRPQGGYQVWVELPFEIDTRDLLADAARAGVLFSPGSQFLPEAGPSRGLRLSLAQAGEEEIRRGIAILGRLVRERQAAAPFSRQATNIHL